MVGREALSAALDDVAVQLASESFRFILRSSTAGAGEVELALLRVVDLELEALARCRDSNGMNTSKAVSDWLSRVNR